MLEEERARSRERMKRKEKKRNHDGAIRDPTEDVAKEYMYGILHGVFLKQRMCIC